MPEPVPTSNTQPDPKQVLTEAGHTWRQTRNAERRARENAYATIRYAAAAGMTQVEIAEVAGVNRMTVRRALGLMTRGGSAKSTQLADFAARAQAMGPTRLEFVDFDD